MVDELDASTLPPRRPLAALVIAVQQAQVLIASLQIHPVHALHGDSGRPLGIPLLHLHRSPSIPRRALCGARRRDVLRHGVLGPLRLIDLARTKTTSVTTSVDGWVEVVGKILLVLWQAPVR